jgi:hypothetical protein
MSRFMDDLLGERIPVTSRGGLVLFRRRYASDKPSSLCVCDIFTGHRTFLSEPPCIDPKQSPRYHLLTSADGIGCAFMLFVANANLDGISNRHTIKAQTARSTCAIWAPAAVFQDSSGFLKKEMRRGAVVLDGGVMHWLVHTRGEIVVTIVTYNVFTTEQGTVQLPVLPADFKATFYLGSYYSHDGRRLLRALLL